MVGKASEIESDRPGEVATFMNDIATCKICGYGIVSGGRHADEVAQEKGFCGAGCQEVYEALKAIEMKEASNG